MATSPATPISLKPASLTPDLLDRIVGAGALVVLAATVLALWQGRGEWAMLPMVVWAHLLCATIALALTPVMLRRRRGDRNHRRLGYVWVLAMTLTAAFSLGVQVIHPGHFSVIHLLSLWTLINLPVIVLAARAHNIARHRRAVRGMAIGALLIAGFFTFTFHRLLAHWLYGG